MLCRISSRNQRTSKIQDYFICLRRSDVGFNVFEVKTANTNVSHTIEETKHRKNCETALSKRFIEVVGVVLTRGLNKGIVDR